MISPKKQSMREKNTEDSNVVLSKNKTKASSQTNPIRKVADVTKRLDNVEYLIKIEDKNKKQLIERYEKQIEKTEKIIEKLEVELKGVIKELNDKETKIYEIQRVKFDSFKQDISKYENIYLDLEEKHKNLIIQISEIKVKEHHSYNQNFMLQEDCLSLRNEIALSKRKIGEYKDILINIEKSYPKEFEFLLEDIRLEKELQEIKQQKST